MSTFNRTYRAPKFFLCVHTTDEHHIELEKADNRFTHYSIVLRGGGTFYVLRDGIYELVEMPRCLGVENATNNDGITLGDSSIGSLRCQQTSITGLSDERDKTDIEDLSIGLDFVNTLRPRKFTWAMREPSANDGKTQTGFIAQELQTAVGSIDYLNLVMDDNPEKLEATPANLIPIMVKAIQELSVKVTALEAG